MARDLFKKMEKPRDIFHAKMGTIKDKNGMDLIEAEEIKKWRVTQKNLMDLMPKITTMVWSLT